MLKSRSRYISFHEIRVIPKPKHCPAIPLIDVLQAFVDLDSEDLSLKLIASGKAALRLVGLTINKRSKLATGLFIYSDTRTSDPAFANLKTGKLRIAKKSVGEGVAVSAHFVMSLAPTKSGGHHLLLENVPGITPSRVSSFLNSNVADAYLTEFEDGSPKPIRTTAKFEVLQQPNEMLRNALKTGELTGIELISHTTHAPMLDEEGIPYISTNVIKVSVGEIDVSSPFKVLRKIMGLGNKEGFSEFKIRFKPVEGKENTISGSTASADDVDQLRYVRIEELEFDHDLQQCTEKPLDLVLHKMTRLMDD